MSIAAARLPTETELKAHNRRTAFRQSIADAAAALEAQKRAAMEAQKRALMAAAAQPAPSFEPSMVVPWLPLVPPEDVAPVPMKIRTIQDLICSTFSVDFLDLISARRTACVVRPRQIAMYLAKKLTTRSLPEIGRRFGGRDHTTVLHAVRKIAAKVELNREARELFDPELTELVTALRLALEARRGE